MNRPRQDCLGPGGISEPQVHLCVSALNSNCLIATSLAAGARLRRSHALPGTFPQRDDLIGSDPGELLFAAIRPDHVDALHTSHRTQTEVGARIVAAQVTLGRIDPGGLATPARVDRDFRAAGEGPRR